MAGIRTTSPQRGASRSLDHMRHYGRTCLSTHLPEASAKKHRSIRAQKHNDPAAPYREAGSYVQASKGTLRPLSALPSWLREAQPCRRPSQQLQRSEEHTSELQSLMRISYAVLCLKNKTNEIAYT